MQTSDYLISLQNDKQSFINKFSEKGVEVTGDETFTELVPKFDEIQGGGDISEYFNEEISAGTSYSPVTASGWFKTLKSLPPFKFNGTSTAYMFSNFSGEELDLSNFNTSNVKSMIFMFYKCSNLTNLDLSNFDTSNVTSMSAMFESCSNLTNLDLSNFDTSNVINMEGMFSYSKMTLNLSNFDTSNVTNMNDTFRDYKAISLNINNFDMSKVIFSNTMLRYANNMENLQFGINLGKGYNQKSSNYYMYGLDVSSLTKITHDSLISIKNGLYDLNLTYGVYDEDGNELGGTLYTQKLVLGTTNLAKLTAEEIALATAKGWTIS